MFNEENTVEQMVLDTLCDGATLNIAAEAPTPFGVKPAGWHFISTDTLIRPGPANARLEATG